MSGTIGHNLPALKDLIPPDTIKALIAAEIEPLKARAEELIGSCKRFAESFPTITDDEADAKAAEILAVCQRFTSKSGRVEGARVALKAPILQADTAIGSLQKGPFAGIVVSVEAAVFVIVRASTNYKVEKERVRREAAHAESKRLADEAALAEKMAERGRGSFDDAATAAQASADAHRLAGAKSADLTRSHGDGVGTTSLKWKRDAVITDATLIPRAYCIPSQSLIDTAKGAALSEHEPSDGWRNVDPVKGIWEKPHPTIPGVVLRDGPDLTVRR